MLTRVKFEVGYLACDKPENNYLKPELPHSSNVNELLPNKRPLIPLSPGRRLNRTESMLDLVLTELIQL